LLLQSDTALVTGTGGGIGLAIAQALEDEGAHPQPCGTRTCWRRRVAARAA
jgi:NAD(P)-dependent dehydrogenase (short-subunit alcohol dehydrogenase family)